MTWAPDWPTILSVNFAFLAVALLDVPTVSGVCFSLLMMYPCAVDTVVFRRRGCGSRLVEKGEKIDDSSIEEKWWSKERSVAQ
jgi:hypothetical protein